MSFITQPHSQILFHTQKKKKPVSKIKGLLLLHSLALFDCSPL